MFLFFFHKRILMEAIVWPTKNIQHDNLLLASRRNVSFAIIKRPLQPPESGNVKLPQSTVGLMNIKSFFLLKPSNSISWFQWLDFWFAVFVQKQRGNDGREIVNIFYIYNILAFFYVLIDHLLVQGWRYFSFSHFTSSQQKRPVSISLLTP